MKFPNLCILFTLFVSACNSTNSEQTHEKEKYTQEAHSILIDIRKTVEILLDYASSVEKYQETKKQHAQRAAKKEDLWEIVVLENFITFKIKKCAEAKQNVESISERITKLGDAPEGLNEVRASLIECHIQLSTISLNTRLEDELSSGDINRIANAARKLSQEITRLKLLLPENKMEDVAPNP